MIYDVTHITTVDYASPVRLAQFNVRLRPAAVPNQTVSAFSLWTTPTPWTIREQAGGYVVNQTRLALRAPITRLKIDCRFRAEVRAPDHAGAPGPCVAAIRAAALRRADLGALAPAAYLFASPNAAASAEIGSWAAPFLDERLAVLDAGRALMAAIHRQFAYEAGATRSDTPPIEAFRARHGVCQDFAHVMIVAARMHGIPAAYVSGYLRTLPPPGRPRLVGADAMHAWAALWCGEALGWVGFDPTNDTLAGTDHIFVAMGRDYGDVSPLDGIFHGGGGQRMAYSVDVAPVG